MEEHKKDRHPHAPTPRIGKLTAPVYICTVALLYNMGETQSVGHTSEDGYEENEAVAYTFKGFVYALIEAYYRQFLDTGDGLSAPYNGSIILSFLTTLQPKATRFLEEYGFNISYPLSAPKYTEHETVVATIHPRMFVQRMKEHVRDLSIDLSFVNMLPHYGHGNKAAAFTTHVMRDDHIPEGLDTTTIF